MTRPRASIAAAASIAAFALLTGKSAQASPIEICLLNETASPAEHVAACTDVLADKKLIASKYLTASNWASVYLWRGIFNAKLGKYSDAIKDFNASLDRNDFDLTYAHRALAYAKLGDFAQAFIDCGKAIAINPTVAMYRAEWGTIQKMKDNYVAPEAPSVQPEEYILPDFALGFKSARNSAGPTP